MYSYNILLYMIFSGNLLLLAPEDYISEEYNVIFPPFETRQRIDLQIVDDNCTEDTEEFLLELGIREDSRFRNVQFCGDTAVPIVDNDGMFEDHLIDSCT